MKHLKTKFCYKLLNIFPSHVFENLQNLETIIVTNCPALEVLFEIQDNCDGLENILLSSIATNLPKRYMCMYMYKKEFCAKLLKMTKLFRYL